MAIKTEPVDTSVPPPVNGLTGKTISSQKTKQAQVDAAELGAARKAAKKAMWDFRKATAWQVHRWPLERRVVQERTRVHLPRSYLGTAGEDVKTVWPGADLNQVVHQHYLQVLDSAEGEEQGEDGKGRGTGRGKVDVAALGANYVAEGNVVARRHEFLGPDPRVAGYFFDVDGEVHVKWWDNFLQVRWMDRTSWVFDVWLSEEGKWVEKED